MHKSQPNAHKLPVLCNRWIKTRRLKRLTKQPVSHNDMRHMALSPHGLFALHLRHCPGKAYSPTHAYCRIDVLEQPASRQKK